MQLLQGGMVPVVGYGWSANALPQTRGWDGGLVDSVEERAR
jgi:hypothetical protein